ncbi:hypothetical protein H4R20_001712 [Coemansia guatemalensis]|uniref:Uncharacterized protein n=1 Tax=Coemansia guatemalensis TaxID=2761395 RepID=A0A9W8HZ26_9FUNG|nr:hypothetical protein H4R20_001712 [Coemansia guatemalensis]
MTKPSSAKKHATRRTGELDSPLTPKQTAETGMGVPETPTHGASVEVIEEMEFFETNELGKNPNEKTTNKIAASMEVTGEPETETSEDSDAERLQYMEEELRDLRKEARRTQIANDKHERLEAQLNGLSSQVDQLLHYRRFN